MLLAGLPMCISFLTRARDEHPTHTQPYSLSGHILVSEVLTMSYKCPCYVWKVECNMSPAAPTPLQAGHPGDMLPPPYCYSCWTPARA